MLIYLLTCLSYVAKFQKIGPTPANLVKDKVEHTSRQQEEVIDKTPIVDEDKGVENDDFGGFDDEEDEEYIQRAKRNAMRKRGLDPHALDKPKAQEKPREKKTMEKPTEKAEAKVPEKVQEKTSEMTKEKTKKKAQKKVEEKTEGKAQDKIKIDGSEVKSKAKLTSRSKSKTNKSKA
jgi:ribosomal RNA methyltransferase Nop2